MTAYPEAGFRIQGDSLRLPDGTLLPWSDGQSLLGEQRLNRPDLQAMLGLPYPAFGPGTPPPRGQDPGRARPEPLFLALYGDCRGRRGGEVGPDLVQVPWLPGRLNRKVRFNRRHGAAAALARVSEDLARIARPEDLALLWPLGGSFACRAIAGTDRRSMHAFGVALDLNAAGGDYWRWSLRADGSFGPWRNRVPMRIVEVFERHGFIWGGRWHHYDTLHFEYRPELTPPGGP